MTVLKTVLTAALCSAALFIPPEKPAPPAGSTPDMSAGAPSTEQFVPSTDDVTGIDEGIILIPKADCDPHMLILVSPDNDPGFLLELREAQVFPDS